MEKQIMIATWKLQPSKTDSRPAAEIRNPKSERPKEIRNPKSEMPRSTTNPKPEVLRISDSFGIRISAALSPRYRYSPASGQPPRQAGHRALPPLRTRRQRGSCRRPGDDLGVVLEAQAEALEQAKAEAPRQLESSRGRSVENGRRADGARPGPAPLRHQFTGFAPRGPGRRAIRLPGTVRVQEHAYQVSRRSNRGRRGNASSGSMQRQLDQMDLTESDNRYEQQRQAQAPVGGQRREQLQVLNRLQELARRQQDLNDRLKELQSALQEARNEEERTEIRRRLKRLRKKSSRWWRTWTNCGNGWSSPENQSSMAGERQQLEQTRQDVQKAAEAAGQGQASQAVAAGTRAQEQLRQIRDNLRKENSSQFAEDLREMRAQARELAGQQEDLQQQMQQEAAGARKSLSDSPERRQMLEQMSRQRDRLTNLVERASQVSEQAEAPEPLLSKQLYDTVRRFSQDSAKDVKDLQEELFSRRAMTRSLLDRLSSQEPDGAKLLDALSELLRQDLLPEAARSPNAPPRASKTSNAASKTPPRACWVTTPRRSGSPSRN